MICTTRVNLLRSGRGRGSNIDIATTGIGGNAVLQDVSKDGEILYFSKSSTFALSTHNHTIAQITGLQGALEFKGTFSESDFHRQRNSTNI